MTTSQSWQANRLAKFHILILSGSSEGFAVAEILSRYSIFRFTNSFAGRTKKRRKPQGLVRVGGFGGVSGLMAYCRSQAIDAIIDATHPFASRIKVNASLAAIELKIPIVHIHRDEWKASPGDRWIEVNSCEDAANRLDAGPALVTVGRQELAPFSRLTGIEITARVIDLPAPETAYPHELGSKPGNELGNELGNWKWLVDRGPFHYQAEYDLLKRGDFKYLVTKNSGGSAAAPKIAAARDLGIPVIIVRRPAADISPKLSKLDDIIEWLEDCLEIGSLTEHKISGDEKKTQKSVQNSRIPY